MKTIILSLTAALIAAVAFFSLTTQAATPQLDAVKQPFTESAFRQAQQDDQLILIDVFATWCPTCKRQQNVLNDYFEQYPDSELVVFVVDFDDQKEWVRYFNAPRQSTLALYRGETQLWFSVAQTRQNAIFAELSQHDAGAE